MGREVMRVPMDFDFPLGDSYADAQYNKHCESCDKEDHDDCDLSHQPPAGPGWQLWQTVSDGPVTPVFATADELIDYMSQPVPPEERTRWAPEAYPDMPAGKGWRREVAERFVRGNGWAPSFVVENGRMMSGVEYVTRDVPGDPSPHS